MERSDRKKEILNSIVLKKGKEERQERQEKEEKEEREEEHRIQEEQEEREEGEKQEEGEEDQELADLEGKIVSISKSFFTVESSNSLKRFKCFYDVSFFPIMIGDLIVAQCVTKPESEDKVIIVKPPLVMFDTDEDSIYECLRKCKFSSKDCREIYSYIAFNKIDLDELACEQSSNEFVSSLIPIKCMSSTKAAILYSWWHKNRILRRLYLLGMNNSEIQNSCIPLSKLFHAAIENPHCIPSISYDKANGILDRLGIPQIPDNLIYGSIIRELYKIMKNGNSRISFSEFKKKFGNVDILKAIEYGIKPYEEHITISWVYDQEEFVAKRLKSIMRLKPLGVEIDSVYLSPKQIEACKMSLKQPLSCISGGAGTGKTTLIKAICEQLESNEIKYVLCSYTGKAVARLKQVTGREAYTIHSLLASPHIVKFKHMIIDEASMVTISLMYDLFHIYKHNMRITFVGDICQLPPIGWGPIFSTLLEIPSVPKVILTENHRSSDSILLHANRMKDGLYETSPSDCYFLSSGDISDVANMAITFYESGISRNELTIITPKNEDVNALNPYLSEFLNVSSLNVTDMRGIKWRVGDRVMCTRNCRTSGVYNGDEGEIIGVCNLYIAIRIGSHVIKVPLSYDESAILDENGIEIQVETSNRETNTKTNTKTNSKTKSTKNSKSEEKSKSTNSNESGEEEVNVLTLSCFKLSYAMTIHKSQGSEWDNIILYLPKSSSFTSRNMIYTALTRAKLRIFVVSSEETLKSCSRVQIQKSNTNLTSLFSKLDDSKERSK